MLTCRSLSHRSHAPRTGYGRCLFGLERGGVAACDAALLGKQEVTPSGRGTFIIIKCKRTECRSSAVKAAEERDGGAASVAAGASRTESGRRGGHRRRRLEYQILEGPIQFRSDLVEDLFARDQVVCEDPSLDIYNVPRSRLTP